MPKAILIVDDEPHILETAQDILVDAGYDVQTAETGASAIQRLQAGPFNLMIVDFNLVDTTGIDLAVQAKQIRPEIVVILMTGEAEVDLGPAKSIVHDVLTKPVDPPKLIELIHRII